MLQSWCLITAIITLTKTQAHPTPGFLCGCLNLGLQVCMASTSSEPLSEPLSQPKSLFYSRPHCRPPHAQFCLVVKFITKTSAICTILSQTPWLQFLLNFPPPPFQEKKIFQIPWMHAARHGWDVEKDAPLFRNWAIHTGSNPCLAYLHSCYWWILLPLHKYPGLGPHEDSSEIQRLVPRYL